MIFVFLIVGVNFHSIGAEGPTNHAPVATLSLLDAVRTTVLQDPGIKIQETEVNAARGRSQQAKGFFDYRLQSSVLRSVTQDVQRYFATNTIPVLLGFKAQRDTNGNLILFRGKPIFDPIIANIYPTNFTRQTINETEFRLALEKLTRSGISFSPSIRLTRLDSSTELPNPDNRADMGLLIRIPLARGLGRKAVTAGETSARLEMEATQLMLRHIVSARVLNTVTAYWGFRAAQERLAILTESEGKALELLDKTKTLVQNNEVPAGELEQLAGNLGEKKASRAVAEQTLFEARQFLGLAMGLPVERFGELGLPADPFPGVEKPSRLEETIPNQLLDLALDQRSDLRASRRLESSADSLLAGARNRMRPQVDLVLRAGYTGFTSGKSFRQFYAPVYEPLQGMNAMGGLTFEWPFGNNAARGAYAAQDAAYQQMVLRSADLSRSIRSGVLVALQQLRNGQAELEAARESAGRYVAAVENEKRKRALGISTLIDVLLLEDRLTGARLSNLSAELNISLGLARLRYETGAILTASGEEDLLSMTQLTTIPKPGGP